MQLIFILVQSALPSSETATGSGAQLDAAESSAQQSSGALKTAAAAPPLASSNAEPVSPSTPNNNNNKDKDNLNSIDSKKKHELERKLESIQRELSTKKLSQKAKSEAALSSLANKQTKTAANSKTSSKKDKSDHHRHNNNNNNSSSNQQQQQHHVKSLSDSSSGDDSSSSDDENSNSDDETSSSNSSSSSSSGESSDSESERAKAKEQTNKNGIFGNSMSANALQPKILTQNAFINQSGQKVSGAFKSNCLFLIYRTQINIRIHANNYIINNRIISHVQYFFKTL